MASVDTRPSAAQVLLQSAETKSLLRFITCGSVDDGKSTLIGRLIYESQGLLTDQLTALESDSRKHGTQGEGLDFALLMDGLEAEREQGITIDVAYRYFETPTRKFIVADCPGHEQYTRNMVTGASTADAAIVLVDVTKGLLLQTRRHAYLLSLLGVRHVILAVNKMDLASYSHERFVEIEGEFSKLASSLGLKQIWSVPISALQGDNLTALSDRMPWYKGPALLELLHQLPDLEAPDSQRAWRLPVQYVNRPSSDFRGYAGTLLGGGKLHQGDSVRVLPAGTVSSIARVIGPSGDLDRASHGQAITVTLANEVDVSRCDVLVAADSPCEIADQFAAHIVWMDEQPLLPGRSYWLQIGARTVAAQVTEIKHRVDINTQEHIAAKRLELNEIGFCNLYLDRAIPFETYEQLRELGSFVLIDRQTYSTAAAGMIRFALRRSANLHWQALDIDKQARANIKQQTPKCIWFTGLSGSGKSTIANLVERKLLALGHHTYILDGDNIRHGLSKDLGFSDEDRVENTRRVAEVAKLMTDAGLIVLVSFISPFRSDREMARRLFPDGEFIEAFVDTSLELAESRDVKGLYAKARAGQLKNFTGIDSPYEPPESPELTLATATASAEELADQVVSRCLAPDSDA